MKAQERNWENLFSHIISSPEGIAWYGTWTIYSPEKEVLKSLQAVREFRVTEPTVITHTNKYTYADGSQEEKSWQLDKQICNQPDGIFHPALPSMRALSFGQGANAGVSQILEKGTRFGAELFFRYQDWRTSVVPIYEEDGNLARITHIREHRGNFSAQPPGSEVKNITGKWIGNKKEMTPDLTISVATETELIFPTESHNKTIFLPDGVVLHLPPTVQVGEEFSLVAGRFVTNQEYKQLTAKYDQSGAFTLLVSEIFQLQE
jgi:Domain of unknown function (DUF3598)